MREMKNELKRRGVVASKDLASWEVKSKAKLWVQLTVMGVISILRRPMVGRLRVGGVGCWREERTGTVP